jgi:hypothetical protein
MSFPEVVMSAWSLDFTWILLVGLTLAGIAIGEGATPGFWVTVTVAVIATVKGRLVIDNFMELGGAHPGIRRLVRAFGLLVPALMVLVHLFAPEIAAITSLTSG